MCPRSPGPNHAEPEEPNFDLDLGLHLNLNLNILNVAPTRLIPPTYCPCPCPYPCPHRGSHPDPIPPKRHAAILASAPSPPRPVRSDHSWPRRASSAPPPGPSWELGPTAALAHRDRANAGSVLLATMGFGLAKDTTDA